MYQTLRIDGDAIHVGGHAMQRKRPVWCGDGKACEILRGEGLLGEPSLAIGASEYDRGPAKRAGLKLVRVLALKGRVKSFDTNHIGLDVAGGLKHRA